jgi:hypothetical protein
LRWLPDLVSGDSHIFKLFSIVAKNNSPPIVKGILFAAIACNDILKDWNLDCKNITEINVMITKIYQSLMSFPKNKVISKITNLFEIYYNEINLNILRKSLLISFIESLKTTLTQIKQEKQGLTKSRYDQIKLLNHNLEYLSYYQQYQQDQQNQQLNLEEIKKILSEIEQNYNNLFNLLTPEYITDLIKRCEEQLPNAQPDDDDDMSFAGGYQGVNQISYKEKYIKYKKKYLNLKNMF